MMVSPSFVRPQIACLFLSEENRTEEDESCPLAELQEKHLTLSLHGMHLELEALSLHRFDFDALQKLLCLIIDYFDYLPAEGLGRDEMQRVNRLCHALFRICRYAVTESEIQSLLMTLFCSIGLKASHAGAECPDEELHKFYQEIGKLYEIDSSWESAALLTCKDIYDDLMIGHKEKSTSCSFDLSPFFKAIEIAAALIGNDSFDHSNGYCHNEIERLLSFKLIEFLGSDLVLPPNLVVELFKKAFARAAPAVKIPLDIKIGSLFEHLMQKNTFTEQPFKTAYASIQRILDGHTITPAQMALISSALLKCAVKEKISSLVASSIVGTCDGGSNRKLRKRVRIYSTEEKMFFYFLKSGEFIELLRLLNQFAPFIDKNAFMAEQRQNLEKLFSRGFEFKVLDKCVALERPFSNTSLLVDYYAGDLFREIHSFSQHYPMQMPILALTRAHVFLGACNIVIQTAREGVALAKNPLGDRAKFLLRKSLPLTPVMSDLMRLICYLHVKLSDDICHNVFQGSNPSLPSIPDRVLQKIREIVYLPQDPAGRIILKNGRLIFAS